MKADYFRYEEEIREAFEHFEVKPPPSVWYGIVDDLPASTPRHKVPQVWLVAAGMALFLTSSVLLWILSGRLESIPDLVALQNNSGNSVERFANNSKNTPAGGTVFYENWEQQLEKEALTGAVSYKFDSSALNSEVLAVAPEPVALLQGSISPATPSLGAEGYSEDDASSSFMQIPDQSIIADFRQPEQARTRIDLGGHFAMRYSSRSFSNNPNLLASNPLQGLENPLMTFDAGISLTLSSKSRLSFQTGVHYSTMGQSVNSIDVFSNPDMLSLFGNTENRLFDKEHTIVTSHGFIKLNEAGQGFSHTGTSNMLIGPNAMVLGQQNPKELGDFGFAQMFSFIEVPLIARFRMIDHGLTMHMKGGVSASYLIGNSVFPVQGSVRQSIGHTFGIRKLNFEGIFGVVFEVPITRSISLQLEPTAQIFFFPMLDDLKNFGRPMPYSFSLFTGITYGF